MTGGNAKAFNPALLSSSARNTLTSTNHWDLPQDGVFVDRTMQERMIEQVRIIVIIL